ATEYSATPSSRLRKPATIRPSGDQYHPLNNSPGSENAGRRSGVCAVQGRAGSTRNVFRPKTVYANRFPSADHTGHATFSPPRPVPCDGSPPRISAVQLSQPPLRVVKNASRLPSGDQRGPRLREGPFVICRSPEPSAPTTKRCSSCSVELNASH